MPLVNHRERLELDPAAVGRPPDRVRRNRRGQHQKHDHQQCPDRDPGILEADGSGDQNQRLEVFLNNAVKKRQVSTARPSDDRQIQPAGSPRANA